MSLGDRLRGRIEEMGPWREGSRAAAVREGALAVQCSLRAADALGVAVEELEMRAGGRGDLTAERVALWADEICRRLGYLREPLSVLEVDAEGPAALLRSARPRTRGEERSYFELLIAADGKVSLRRLCVRTSSEQPETVPFTLTLEQLADLVDDLAAARPTG